MSFFKNLKSIFTNQTDESTAKNNKEKITLEKESIPDEIITFKKETVPDEIITKVNETSDMQETVVEKPSNKLMVTYLTGLNFEGRQKLLKKIVKEMKDNDEFAEYYGGDTNAMIKDSYMYDEKVWELESEFIFNLSLKAEPDNAFDKNAIQVLYEDESVLGYIPRKDCEEIHANTSELSKVAVTGTIVGGKYKFLDMNDSGDEVVRTKTVDYNLDLMLEFT